MNPGGSHLAIIDGPAKRLFHATGMPFRIETGGQAVEEHGPVHIVLDVFFARPDDLDRAVDVFGDLDGTLDAVALQSPAETAADQMVVHHDLVQRQTCDLRGRLLGARERLIADPDLASVGADMNRAVHRLHGRVREERNMVGRFDLGHRTRHRLVDITDVLRDHARLECRLFKLGQDVLGGELAMRAVVPFDRPGPRGLSSRLPCDRPPRRRRRRAARSAAHL